MNRSDIISKCKEFGEFYLHYEKMKPGAKGTTYLQGTMDIDDDKYLSARAKQENIKPANSDDVILVFSRTNDSFRYMPISKIRRITSLQSELDRSSPLGRRR